MAKRVTIFVAFVCLVSFVSCGGGGGGGDSTSRACGAVRLLNGETCGQSSSVARLEITMNNGQRSVCTGTFISSTSILTAAHCLASLSSQRVEDNLFAESITVLMSGGSTEATGRKINRLYFDSFFAGVPYANFDVGIVKVDPNFISAVGGTITPLLVTKFPEIGDTLVINGYGQTETGETTTDIKAAEVVLTGVDDIFRYIVVPRSQEDASVCFGDSGGALLQEDETGDYAVTAVTSFGLDLNSGTSCGFGSASFFAPITNKGNNDFLNAEVPDAIRR